MDNFEEGMYIITNEFFENEQWRNRIGTCIDVRNRNSTFPLEIEFIDGLILGRKGIPIRFREVNISQTFLLNKLLL